MADCESELSKVMPPLIKALKELRAIDKASIAELKVGYCTLYNGNPPTGHREDTGRTPTGRTQGGHGGHRDGQRVYLR